MKAKSSSTKRIFVFGSNQAGRHGRGAAKFALENCGAIYGIGYGRQGNAFAIPTKDKQLKVLPINKISNYVTSFISYAKRHPNLSFLISRVGCGLAGYKDKDIAPLFREAPINCYLPREWTKYY
jgi:hypothetical protein